VRHRCESTWSRDASPAISLLTIWGAPYALSIYRHREDSITEDMVQKAMMTRDDLVEFNRQLRETIELLKAKEDYQEAKLQIEFTKGMGYTMDAEDGKMEKMEISPKIRIFPFIRLRRRLLPPLTHDRLNPYTNDAEPHFFLCIATSLQHASIIKLLHFTHSPAPMDELQLFHAFCKVASHFFNSKR